MNFKKIQATYFNVIFNSYSKGENIIKWIKGQRINWLGHLERTEEDRMTKKIFTQELEGTRRRRRPRKRWKEEVERDLQALEVRRWRELLADRKEMEGHCSTGQSPQWAVVPIKEEEDGDDDDLTHICLHCIFLCETKISLTKTRTNVEKIQFTFLHNFNSPKMTTCRSRHVA